MSKEKQALEKALVLVQGVEASLFVVGCSLPDARS